MARKLFATAAQRPIKTSLTKRLQKVIEGIDVKSGQRILVVSSDENGCGHPIDADSIDDGEAVQFGHLNIEKNKLGFLGQDCFHGRLSIAAFAKNFNIRVIFEEAAN